MEEESREGNMGY